VCIALCSVLTCAVISKMFAFHPPQRAVPCCAVLCCAVLCSVTVCVAGGKKVETIIGAVPKSTMEQAISKYL
jgi:hypothetical protein